MPTIRMPKAVTMPLAGIWPCPATTRSYRNAGAVASSPRLMICPENSPLPRKKNPAIGRTTPIALKANTRPSTMCSADVSMNVDRFRANAAPNVVSSAMPPTSAAASPPCRSGTESDTLATTR